jgi:hypothetical protein
VTSSSDARETIKAVLAELEARLEEACGKNGPFCVVPEIHGNAGMVRRVEWHRTDRQQVTVRKG